MAIKKAIGRPPKINIKIIDKIADSIQHNYSISDACKFAGVSRDTYYRYLHNEPVFAEKMTFAHENKNKVLLSFLTVPQVN
jgi:ACT domain-containing protein